MRVAYYFDDYPGCHLTDLNSLLNCFSFGKGSDVIFAHLCQLMFEPIELFGLSRQRLDDPKKSGDNVLPPTLKAVADGIADTTMHLQSITEDRLKYLSFSMPFYETHLAIAMNRDLAQFYNSYD